MACSLLFVIALSAGSAAPKPPGPMRYETVGLDEEADAADGPDVLDLPAPAAAALGESPRPRPTGAGAGDASMQFMVTQRMKAELMALGYSEAEAQRLNPQRAAAILEHSIRRPSRGVPSSWNRAAGGRKSLGRAIGRSCAAIARAGVLASGALLVYVGSGGTLPPAQQRLLDQAGAYLERHIMPLLKPPTRYTPDYL